jgi:2-aminoadipate transaminase
VNTVALQYSPPLQSLKQHVRELMKQRGVNCREEQIFLTAGAQQGMSLLSRLLLEPGDSVITEELIYTGFQQVLEPFQPRVLTVSTDAETGMDVDAVEQCLSGSVRRPSFIYAITDGHNPLSVRLHPSKRARLVELAEQYHVPIIEDDAYGFLCYENPLPPLRALSKHWVFYVGSFSKILAPALRAGWLVVPEELILPLSVIKESSDIDAAPLSQHIVNTYLDTGQLPARIDMLRTQYGLRRDVMMRALAENFPDAARWTKPDCGFFVWVELPPAVDVDEVFRRAIEDENVAFIPGHAFSVNNKRSVTPSIRLNFSHPTTARIEEGIPRLARVLKSVMG